MRSTSSCCSIRTPNANSPLDRTRSQAVIRLACREIRACMRELDESVNSAFDVIAQEADLGGDDVDAKLKAFLDRSSRIRQGSEVMSS
ncbi:hypothetical protein [Intrasporangium mesophilum]